MRSAAIEERPFTVRPIFPSCSEPWHSQNKRGIHTDPSHYRHRSFWAITLAAWAVLTALALWIAPIGIAKLPVQQGLCPLGPGVLESAAASPQACLDGWSDIAAAVPLAALLHVVLVLFIRSTRKRHGAAKPGTVLSGSGNDIFLILYCAAFLLLSIPIWSVSMYGAYLLEWQTVLAGVSPWSGVGPRNAYGPLFNLLAPLMWLGPLALKVTFAFSYLLFSIWLICDLAPRRGIAITPLAASAFWYFNPFPLIEILVFGHFDILVALTCVASVHACVRGKEISAGIALAAGILLKYVPIVILPFLIIDAQGIRSRLLAACLVTTALGLGASLWIWGASTFLPLEYAAARTSSSSIYDALNRTPSLLEYINSPFRPYWNTSNIDWLATPLLMATGLGIFVWCIAKRTEPVISASMAVLVTLLFYRIGYIHYEIILFLLLSYWAVSNWEVLNEKRLLPFLLIAHFSVLALLDLTIVFEMVDYGRYGRAFILLKFLTGVALLIGLMHFSARGLKRKPAPTA